MTEMIADLEVVALTRAVPEHGLEAGDVGTIVHVHPGERPGYMVEFMDFRGNTLAIVSVPADAVRPVREGEIAHARQVA